MATSNPVIYLDDPDASWTYTVTSSSGATIDWASPVVAIKDGSYAVTATWLGATTSPRQIRVPLVGLTKGNGQTLYLRVPSGTDIRLGQVDVKART